MLTSKVAVETPGLKGEVVISILTSEEFESLISTAKASGANITQEENVYVVGEGLESYTLTVSGVH